MEVQASGFDSTENIPKSLKYIVSLSEESIKELAFARDVIRTEKECFNRTFEKRSSSKELFKGLQKKINATGDPIQDKMVNTISPMKIPNISVSSSEDLPNEDGTPKTTKGSRVKDASTVLETQTPKQGSPELAHTGWLNTTDFTNDRDKSSSTESISSRKSSQMSRDSSGLGSGSSTPKHVGRRSSNDSGRGSKITESCKGSPEHSGHGSSSNSRRGSKKTESCKGSPEHGGHSPMSDSRRGSKKVDSGKGTPDHDKHRSSGDSRRGSKKVKNRPSSSADSKPVSSRKSSSTAFWMRPLDEVMQEYLSDLRKRAPGAYALDLLKHRCVSENNATTAY